LRAVAPVETLSSIMLYDHDDLQVAGLRSAAGCHSNTTARARSIIRTQPGAPFGGELVAELSTSSRASTCQIRALWPRSGIRRRSFVASSPGAIAPRVDASMLETFAPLGSRTRAAAEGVGMNTCCMSLRHSKPSTARTGCGNQLRKSRAGSGTSKRFSTGLAMKRAYFPWP
jgi:hypothetical protein